MSSSSPSESIDQITCPQCHEPIPAGDVNLSTGLARCVKCDCVFNVAGRAHARNNAIPVGMPKRIRVEDMGDRLVISRRWFTPIAFFLLFFAVFWDGFLVFWYSIALGSGDLVALLFPMLHVAAGVGITYFMLTLFLNTTTISLDANELRVRHHPLPWLGSRGFNPAEIQQLFCKRRWNDNQNTGAYYQIWAIMMGDKRKKILGCLPQYEQARYIEQRLEQAMGIVDQRVDGEARD